MELLGDDGGLTGTPDFFIAHSWDQIFSDTVEQVPAYIESIPELSTDRQHLAHSFPSYIRWPMRLLFSSRVWISTRYSCGLTCSVAGTPRLTVRGCKEAAGVLFFP